MEYRINNDEKSIECNGERLYIPKKEFLIFSYLYNNPNRVITREEFLQNVWGENVVVEPRTVDVHIRSIKKKFPDVPIATRRCYGYFWKSDVLQ